MIIKLKDKECADLKTLKKYTRKNFRPLWVSNYYDRPLSGLGQILGGKYVWFDVVSASFNLRYRKYFIVELNNKQLDSVIERKQDFEEYVSETWSLDENWNRKPDTMVRKISANLFYNKYKNMPAIDAGFSENEIIGWFTWTDAKYI